MKGRTSYIMKRVRQLRQLLPPLLSRHLARAELGEAVYKLRRRLPRTSWILRALKRDVSSY